MVEAAFRIANERMFRWEERHADGASELYLCECADPDCREKVDLAKDRYEAVRHSHDHFLVKTGHVLPELEEVVQTHSGYQVIEKPGALMDVLEQTDPRTQTTGPARERAESMADDITPGD